MQKQTTMQVWDESYLSSSEENHRRISPGEQLRRAGTGHSGGTGCRPQSSDQPCIKQTREKFNETSRQKEECKV